jgi:hypothetical protein
MMLASYVWQEVEVENEVMTNDDILGDAIPSAQQIDMQKICCMALGVVSIEGYIYCL